MTTTETDYTKLRLRYLELAAIRDDIDTEMESIKAAYRALGAGRYCEDKVTVTPQQRFDPAQASFVLPENMLQSICVTKPDTKLARQILPPALYEACMVPVGEPKVNIK